MTREEERHEAAKKFAFSGKTETPDFYNVMNDFYYGALWADNNPRMFKGQTEKMEEREIAFMDWWLENHKGESPTFADAIAWADKTMLEKACEWLSKTLYIHTEEIEDKHWNEIKTFDWVTSDFDSVSDFIEGFRKAMEE